MRHSCAGIEGVGLPGQISVVCADVLAEQANVIKTAQLVILYLSIHVQLVQLCRMETQDIAGSPGVTEGALGSAGKVVGMFGAALQIVRIHNGIVSYVAIFQQFRLCPGLVPLVAQTSPRLSPVISDQQPGFHYAATGRIAPLHFQIEVLHENRTGREAPETVDLKANQLFAGQSQQASFEGTIRPQLSIDRIGNQTGRWSLRLNLAEKSGRGQAARKLV